MNILPVLELELLRKNDFMISFRLVCKIHKISGENWKHAENDLSWPEVFKICIGFASNILCKWI